MGPFVDVVRDAVAPVLQELGGRPGVVDLVEVHLVRLGEAEHAQAERREHEDDEEPQRRAGRAGRPLSERGRLRSARTGRSASLARNQPIEPELRERGAVAPGGQGRRRTAVAARRAGAATPRRRRPAAAPPAGATAGPSPTSGRARDDRPPARCRRPSSRPRRGRRRIGARCRRGLASSSARRVARPRRSWASAHRNATRVDDRDERSRPAASGWPRRCRASPAIERVVRVERRQDHVHVRERRDRQDDVGDPPAPRDREQDRPEREEREPVALVDAGRQRRRRPAPARLRTTSMVRRSGSRAATHRRTTNDTTSRTAPTQRPPGRAERRDARAALVDATADARRRPTGRCSARLLPGRRGTRAQG